MTHEELTQQVAALQQELAGLRRDFTDLASRPRAALSLKRDLRCPQCDGRKILHAAHIPDRAHGTHKEMSIGLRKKWYDPEQPLGNFEVFSCIGCGLSEWYVPNLEAVVEEIVESGDGLLRVIDASDPSETGPYR